MVEIKNTNVYNLEEALLASGNAMRLEPLNNKRELYDDEAIIKSSLERCKKLAKCGGGSGHSNFRTGILVTFDLKYEQYFSKQIQRYHFFQYVSSTSMMHRITKMDFSKCCNKYVSKSIIKKMNQMINLYNLILLNKDEGDKQIREYNLNESAEKVIPSLLRDYQIFLACESTDNTELTSFETIDDVLYDLYMRIISNCPMGAELWVHCSTNYEQLATIYKQRKNHKLKEDWGEFCKWIESLPYAQELIICE